MASSMPPAAGSAVVGLDTRRLRDGLIVSVTLLVALTILYAVFLDQGALLSPVLGKLSASANYIHEFAHDARHLLGAPCH
ncbi:MAG: hypothetical protein AUG49_02575 [Catenulispora sp. 13_1_20CM_3_70_7]|jgi:hypothetical protein|nr:MAG: hypothetical protein AUG49_02575 [Catenulispora sp. 13_1_20CM_3_70_7]